MTNLTSLMSMMLSPADQPLLAELCQSHVLLNNFSRFLPGMFFQYQRYSDTRFSFPYVSAAVESLFEVSAAQLRADPGILFSRIHPDDRQGLHQAICRSAEELSVWHHEYRVTHSDGSEHWLVGDATPERLADGSVLWHGFLSDQTERKLTEQKLLAAEQQRHLVMKASSQGLYDINLQTGEGQFSTEYMQMLGFSPEDFPDQEEYWHYFWTEGVHPDDVAGLKQAYQKHFSANGDHEYHAEFRQKNKAGEWRWLMAVGAVVEWDAHQRPLRMVGTHIDITERKAIEEQLRLNQEMLSASKNRYKGLARELEILIENAPVGIMFVSNGVIVRANNALAELCRFPHARAMIGAKTSFLYQDEADYHAFSFSVTPVLLADELVEIEWQLRRADGQAFLARVVGRALPSEKYEKGAVWMIEDITEQRQTLDALRDRESRLQRLMNSSLIGIIQGNQNSYLIDANQVFCQLCGYPRDSLLGQSQVWELLLSESDRYICRQAYAELLDTGTTAPFEIMLKHADGHTVPVLVGLNLLANSQREWVAFAMDISDRLRINQLKTEFISVVSHELRTPLTSIRGSLSLLESGVVGELNASALELVRIAHSNSKRLISLVNDILDIDKLANGKMSMKSEPVDLIALLHTAIEANAPYASSLQVGLILEQQVLSAHSLGDYGRLMQVMANLISNAAKFSPEGESVVIRISRHGQSHHIAVSDRGPGIPLAFQAHLFEPFTQADGTNTRQQGGSGLGLPITKALIENMHGSLHFHSVPEAGTTFWFELPVYQPGPAD
jgi:PAS domain S-box-containing protein